jgi:hypothetical protein
VELPGDGGRGSSAGWASGWGERSPGVAWVAVELPGDGGGSDVAWAAVELPGDGGRGSSAGWASGWGERSPGVAWAVVGLPGDGRGVSSATAAARHMRAGEKTENEPTRARDRRLNSFISDGHLGDRRT